MAGPAGLADQLKRTFAGDGEGEAWHGPALEVLLRDVAPGAATARPVAAAHSIAEIVLHLAAWKEWGADRLAGGSLPNPAADGWTRVERLSPKEWDAARTRLRDGHARLLAAVDAAEEDPVRLAAARDRILFLIHHDIYHGGQIGLLRKAPPA